MVCALASKTRPASKVRTTSATFTVTSVRDGYTEPEETVVVTVLSDDAVYPAGTPAAATLTITNTPAPSVIQQAV